MKRLALLSLVAVYLSACADSSNGRESLAPVDGVANNGTPVGLSDGPVDIAVIGDTPYGSSAIALFPDLVDAINDDPAVSEVVHVGDLKSGSELCTDARFQIALDLYNTFEDPFIYAIGDNEWTDCHRVNNGGFYPLERLAKVREMFYPVPGSVLGGGGKQVEAQDGYPENQLWVESGVTFVVFHIIGSNNGLEPWFTQAGQTPETPAQTAARIAEVTARQAANIQWLQHAFATAQSQHSVGVVLFYQADLWHPDDRAAGATFTAHEEWIKRMSNFASAYQGKVLLISGDSHDYRVDAPASWLGTYYGVKVPSNLTQIIVDRSVEAGDASVLDYVRLHVDPTTTQVFSWTNVVVP